MKLILTYACVLVHAGTVNGNVIAAPYQALFLWYAYRMDVQAAAAGGTRNIAPGCNNCDFDDFLKYIAPTHATWQGPTGVGSNLTPDVEATATILSAQGYKNSADNSKLLNDPTIKNFHDTFNKILQHITAARTLLKDSKLTVEVVAVQYAMSATHMARLKDDAGYRLRALNIELTQRNLGPALSRTLTSTPLLGSWQEYDPAAMARAYGGSNTHAVAQGAIVQYENDKVAKAHFKAIAACQSILTKLMTPCN